MFANRLTNVFFATLLLLGWVVSDVFAQSDRIALITDMKGEVALAKKGSQTFAKADWGTPLFEGDRIRTGLRTLKIIGHPAVPTNLFPTYVFRHSWSTPLTTRFCLKVVIRSNRHVQTPT